ncbi:SpoIIE family protein phosphatase/ATP-binding protein [Streptomyces sp. SAJ15]|uniref:SpoIIE family protein phosphatase/ATP-binding protein n=1 Tax=Streptomyces sp. SAJ15 TaxID=2011095 RepID=UPI0011868C5E|nr:SpoIIE family protein phosphatase/ATP-binding protein [Streptomyces sp. SAJ15]TVL91384.1 histidine kinase [Streptomyces sp. SAJ15]
MGRFRPSSTSPTTPARGQSRGERPRSILGVRSVAGQALLLQVTVILLIVTAGVVALVLQAERDSTTEARRRSLAVAQTFANSPGMIDALRSPDPSAILQPMAETARKKAGMDFIVIMTPEGIRYTHPQPERIGKKFVGTIGPAREGKSLTETVTGPLGVEMQAVVPIEDSEGEVVGLASAGMKTRSVSSVVNRQLPILLGGGAAGLALAMGGTALATRRLSRQTHGLGPAEMARMYEHHDAVLHAVREGVLIVSGDHRLLLANDEARRLLALPEDAEGRQVDDLGLNPHMTELLMSGRQATDEVVATGDRLLAVNQRTTDRFGGPPGTVATLRDTTDLHTLSGKAAVARDRLRLLYDASVEIGTTLDVARTAEELAQATVPKLADFTTVDLVDAVLQGEEPPLDDIPELRRTAISGIRDDHPLYPAGRLIKFVPSTPQARGLGSARGVIAPDLHNAPGWQAQDPERVRWILDYGIHSLMTVPLRARGVVLGVCNFWRSVRPEPFEEDDLSLAEELVAHAAVCIDNARRYTREHDMAVTLQRSLLPRGLPEQSALDVAYRYLPAQAGVGGDWFDVIPLPGARVALVVGDVVGHGLHAAATMGRLRTAVHNFSTLDMAPDELLSHLSELVAHIDQDETATGSAAITGATCLYAIYDPVERCCVLARAGHVPPAVLLPDGTVELPELPAGTPLGLAGLPFEAAELHLAEGSKLVLYTDGLIEHRERSIDTGLDLLRDTLAGSDATPEETCRSVLDVLLPPQPEDDIVLLVAGTRAVEDDRIAEWDVPADPAAVAVVRSEVTRRLEEWGMGEEAFTTELILSELITNAIRYGASPIRVRLLLDRCLICEVSDASSTSPHLRHAATMDEGGRGLFLVAQFAERWGTRYTPTGKVIWTEQPLPPEVRPPNGEVPGNV